jgi:cytochrome c peroxidase
MRISAAACLGLVAAMTPAAPAAAPGAPPIPLEPEIRLALTQSPLPPLPPDPTNPVQSDARAQALGARLFTDRRLSGARDVACASCHRPERGWSDGEPLPVVGKPGGVRRVPSIRNAAYQRWFNWDGGADTLWSQVLGPIENANEMAGSRHDVARLVANDAQLSGAFRQVFGEAVLEDCRGGVATQPATPRRADAAARCFRAVGQALAAFVSTIVTSPNRFDAFVARVKDGAAPPQAGLTAAELAGLRLFFGRARCATCHSGALFSNGQFHNLGIYPTVPGGWKDSGRLDGVRKLLASEFNVMKAGLPAALLEALATPYLQPRPAQWGQFKTPSLRNAAIQSRFMHHGQFASLAEVVRFYSDFVGMDLTDHHRELSIMPLGLSAEEQANLVAFLRVIGE